MKINIENILIKPLTKSNWNDFENLFGPKGAYGGCWCMWWRLPRKEFETGQGESNHKAMKSLIQSGNVTGLLAYSDGKPCGWCSVAPREHFGCLERSRVLKRIDNEDVWSLVCFFIDREHRGKNLGFKLTLGAIEYVKSQGGKIIEAYPTIIKSGSAPPVSTFMGIPEMLSKAGFKKIHQPSKSKLIMRYFIS